jgi:hypothetical protein
MTKKGRHVRLRKRSRNKSLSFPFARGHHATMKSPLRSFLRGFSRLLPARKLSRRSQLFNLYFSQTNTKDAYSSEFQQTRERRNGKYALNRERT